MKSERHGDVRFSVEESAPIESENRNVVLGSPSSNFPLNNIKYGVQVVIIKISYSAEIRSITLSPFFPKIFWISSAELGTCFSLGRSLLVPPLVSTKYNIFFHHLPAGVFSPIVGIATLLIVLVANAVKEIIEDLVRIISRKFWLTIHQSRWKQDKEINNRRANVLTLDANWSEMYFKLLQIIPNISLKFFP
jgi:hypothetical protein